MSGEAKRQLAKLIAGAPLVTPTKAPEPLSWTRGVVSSFADGVATVQLASSAQDVEGDVLGSYVPNAGDIVEVIINSPRVIILGPLYPGSDTGWIAVTFEGSWTNYTGDAGPASYRKIGNMIAMQGQIDGDSSGSVAFNLPDGFRPPGTRVLACGNDNNSAANAAVFTDGDVQIGYNSGVSYIDICGITFFVN